MADVRKGSNDIPSAYVEGKVIEKIYKGSTLIYTKP
jgi:hypothetical protein